MLRLADGGSVHARAVVLAAGARYRKLAVQGIEALEGTSVYYAATHQEARICGTDPIAIVGGGNSAGQAAVFLAEHVSQVHLLIRGDDLGKSMSRYLVDQIEHHPRVTVHRHTEIRAVHGEKYLEAIAVEDNRTGDQDTIRVRALFVFIGATTENPSFALNAALLSRAQVLILHRLDARALDELLARAETLAGPLPLTDDARAALVASADGDGRFLLNQAETLYNAKIPQPLDPAGLGAFLQRRVAVYDKDRDGHYNLISALHKALRGSDPQASLYYLARMLTAGEEPLYVLRRLVRFASEDIGLADPQALTQCLAAKDAYQFLGSPEGELAIVQACLYLATAPKSNAAYVAQKEAWQSAKETGSLPPPAHILNAPTKLMKDIGYGAGYAYDHEAEDGFSGADYWPEGMAAQDYYRPVERGFERDVLKRLEWWDKKRRELRGE